MKRDRKVLQTPVETVLLTLDDGTKDGPLTMRADCLIASAHLVPDEKVAAGQTITMNFTHANPVVVNQACINVVHTATQLVQTLPDEYQLIFASVMNAQAKIIVLALSKDGQDAEAKHDNTGSLGETGPDGEPGVVEEKVSEDVPGQS